MSTVEALRVIIVLEIKVRIAQAEKGIEYAVSTKDWHQAAEIKTFISGLKDALQIVEQAGRGKGNPD